jgi:hypothetical protein
VRVALTFADVATEHSEKAFVYADHVGPNELPRNNSRIRLDTQNVRHNTGRALIKGFRSDRGEPPRVWYRPY